MNNFATELIAIIRDAGLAERYNLSTYFFTQRKFNGLITRYGCGHSGIGKEIRKI